MKITIAPCDVQPKDSRVVYSFGEVFRLVIDLSRLTAEEIKNTITTWQEENNIDAWAISESDDEFQPVLDSTAPEVWAAWAEAFEEHGEAILKFWDEVLGFNYCKDVAEVLEIFEGAYQGEFADNEEWARDFIDSCYTLESPLKDYFDYEKYARDCEGDMTFIDADNGNVFVFNSDF